MSNPPLHNPAHEQEDLQLVKDHVTVQMFGVMKMKFFPPFKDEGEVIASWGQAQLIKA
jgi:hypothetical protein